METVKRNEKYVSKKIRPGRPTDESAERGDAGFRLSATSGCRRKSRVTNARDRGVVVVPVGRSNDIAEFECPPHSHPTRVIVVL